MKALAGAGGGLRERVAALSRDKVDMLFLVLTCALIMAPHGLHLPAWITQVALGLLGWRCWITFRGDRLPPRWLLLPTCLLVMAGVLISYRAMLGRDTGVAMLVLLVAFKLLEMHGKRDAFVVVFLSFFLILMNFFYSQTVLTTLLMALAVVLVLTVQISFHYALRVPPLRERLRLAGSIVGMALPLMLVLFVLFPRFSGPFWGMQGQGSSGVTGLSNSMAPGNISNLALSSDIAFRVQFEGPPPPNARLYWRGPVLGHFDGRTWTPLPASRSPSGTLALQTSGASTRYRVTMEPSNQQSIFVLEMPDSLPRVAGHVVQVQPDLQLLTRTPIVQRVRYEAGSRLQFRWPGNETALSLRDWVQLPAGFNPRAHQLAAELLRTGDDPARLVQRVLEMFRKQAYRYTLTPPALGQHTVDEFLFDTRAGFCEHFSNAFVVLMRAMDIPARVVTGYQGGELNRLDDYLTVRQSDAHAWAEVWLAGSGWTRVDPTAAVAPERIENSARSALPQTLLGGLVRFDVQGSAWAGMLERLRMNWDAMNNRWNQWVLDYSARSQRDLLEALGFEDTGWKTLGALLAAALSLALLVAGMVLLRNRREKDLLELLYQRFSRHLSAQGAARALHEGPRSWRQRLLAEQPAHPAKLRAWAEFLELYENLRYARPSGQPLAGRDPGLDRLKTLLTLCR